MSDFQIKNLDSRIAAIPQHSDHPPPEAASPSEHYRLGAREAWNLVNYFARKIQPKPGYEPAYELHARNLRNMVLLALVESFERFLKEVAAVCIDHLLPVVTDDRVSGFGDVHASRVAAHFDEGSAGKAICEASTWSSTKEIERRFNPLLADLANPSRFKLFPQPKDPDAWRQQPLDVLFQLRHTIAHNVGLITRSDALKLRRHTKRKVDAPMVLAPTKGDVWYAKVFLDQTVAWLNVRICEQLCHLLTEILADNPSAFDAPSTRVAIAEAFRWPATIGGETAVALPGR